MRPAVRIIFKPLGREHSLGQASLGERTIWIDPRGKWPAHTLLHELLHVRHPSWTEWRVKRETARQWKRMGWREKARLLKMLSSARLDGEVSLRG